MEEQKEISIAYKHYIPEEWIDEVEASFQKSDISFMKTKDSEEYYNSFEPDLSDIIIFIKDNPESIFLAPALYDILRSSIIMLYKKLNTLIVQKIQSNKSEPKQKKISIRYEDPQQRRVTIDIEGDLDYNLIEEIIEDSLEILKTDKKEEFFRKPDFVDKSQGFDAVELKYNPETKVWEPENFGNIRKKMDDFQKWANENFDS